MPQIERSLPLDQLNALARMESYNKHHYRPVNYVHKWWARRLGSVFRTVLLSTLGDDDLDVWQTYYEGLDLGKVVLDPFMGGGTTITEALRLGCKVVGSDLNPVAWWTVRQAISPVTPEALDVAFSQIEDTVAQDLLALYRTRCPVCSGDADAVHVLWVRLAPCVNCRRDVALHPSHVLHYEKATATVFCPICNHIFASPDSRRDNSCPACDHIFLPRQGVVDGSWFTCPDCGRRQTILEATRRAGKILDHEIYALIVQCPEHGQGIKEPDASDRKRYQTAVAEFDLHRESLLFPRQAIPPGLKTDDLRNHNYRYWYELFSPRQLLALDRLLRSILALESEAERDLMITLFSSSLEFNNLFCSYKGGHAGHPGAVRHIFSHHAFVVPRQALENNLWGVNGSSGSFSALYRSRLLRSREYAQAPVERKIHEGRVVKKVRIPNERIAAAYASSYTDLSKGANALLLCQDSSHLYQIPDKSVDAVITDPPYYDNVQYAELADFFYVWLRLALSDRFPAFEPEFTPKVGEVVANSRRQRDADSYLEGLSSVFRECSRVLKDNRLMVFTFHHKDPTAWASVLQAVLDAGFSVRATYPVLAEMGRSVHIQAQEAMEYDAILVCSKREAAAAIKWEELEERIWRRARAAQMQLAEINGSVSRMETSVIVMGKCLEFFSQHHPYVVRDGMPVSASEAIVGMQAVIDEIAALTQPYAPAFQPRLLREDEES